MVKYVRKVSSVLFNKITEDYWEKHEEAAMHYANLKASIDEYYDENIAYRDQTDKLVETSMSALDKSSTTIKDLYKGLNIITELLKEINNAVKDDPATNKKIHEATETFVKIFTNITKVLSLVKGFNFSDLHFTVKDLQAHVVKQEAELADWSKSSTNMAWNLGLIQRVLSSGRHALCKVHDERDREGDNVTHVATKDLLLILRGRLKTRSLKIQRWQKGKGIATNEQAEKRKLVKALSIVHPDPDASILIPYTINGKLFHLMAQQLQAHLDKEEQIKKAKEQARLLAITKPEVVKDVELMTLHNEKIEKARKSLELRKHEYDNYIWTISSRQKFEKITDVKVHLKTKPVVITIYRGTNGRNFKVHNPFSFGAFAITELDELKEIIPKKKNIVVQDDLMNSLSRRYERIRKIPEELGIQFALPTPVSEQASSQTLGRKRKHISQIRR
ncbi:hypothetical protein Tco_1123650 [Tanacetum coccineum]|uniref:Uncharacterized protein n=1 Tax=Tanacetum coccineum TaxID=301880 RepID=A0ABQ5J5M8_9ASTR